MSLPSIIYWKWDDSHLSTGKYLRQIDDIADRSGFSHIYITTHWCHKGASDPDTHRHLKAACEKLNSRSRQMILELDVRAEKANFAKAHPDDRAGFAYWKIVSPAESNCTFRIAGQQGGELFGGDRQSGDELLTAVSFRTDESGRVTDVLPLPDAVLTRTDSEQVTVEFRRPDGCDTPVFVAVWSQFDFPDLFSDAYAAESRRLMESYRDLPIAGAALDELCFMWHPDFDFTEGSWLALDDCPVYSRGMASAYAAGGHDYVRDLVFRFASDREDPRRIAAINRYFHTLRHGIADAENAFYRDVKEVFGKDAFVGVHNTWFCIEEVQNSPEIWRTGITWWSAVKDYGFTDEVMQMAVRTALAHKASAPVFYNMWYSEATVQLSTFYTELWRNLRHGGRTISLSYECIHETGGVQQLIRPGELEAIAAIEECIPELEKFVCSPADCRVAVVVSLAALCNRLHNENGHGRWDGYAGKLKEVFCLVRDLTAAGYNCDLIGDDEIDEDHLAADADGKLRYGSQCYDAVIVAYPQYIRPTMPRMLSKLKGTRLIIIGKGDRDFDGQPVTPLREQFPAAPYFPYRPEIGDVTGLLDRWRVPRNQVPCGCRMQDGTIILTAPAPDRPVGNAFSTTFSLDGYTVTAGGEDLIALRLAEDGTVSYYSPRPATVTVEKE